MKILLITKKEIQYAWGCKFNIDEFVNWIDVNRQSILV